MALREIPDECTNVPETKKLIGDDRRPTREQHAERDQCRSSAVGSAKHAHEHEAPQRCDWTREADVRLRHEAPGKRADDQGDPVAIGRRAGSQNRADER